ncbi:MULTISPECIES: plasmid mobilization protein [Pseudomonas]|nr:MULTISPECIES: plasmid mobilization relaxosome protein MobC [Pseudomonas]MBK5411075.1 plasmid mobilization relaxosome protein MobC [Pseudomonas sp. TH34]MCK9694360.1 MobC family plasmid mobilization relaxosome protein [Pseudomonas syringae pv. syringae]MCK9704523.1 MobC family plasmid mobilization relaxosome protein [Pseudomonas syringae pv. syringae]MCK9759816.1 MobC family plasmid mobilization relaxosome protein [Pseudomonas syringae pv. syringae]MCK9774807.1 MobC family plasmid mobilizati
MPRKASIGATRDSAVYRVRIPDDLKSEWEAHCEKKGSSQHGMIRALMRYVIQDEMPQDVHSWISGQIAGEPDEGQKQRLEVRFTPSEHHELSARSEAEGCSPQRWVINCVRASLTNQPQFTMEATKALWESSGQLRSIGRNLNQIAKKMNEGGSQEVAIKEIQKLSTYIYCHTEIVSALQDASLSRWKLKSNLVENS